MANLEEILQYDAGVYQIETNDPVLGGPNGIANQQAKNLANRTKFLKKKIDDIMSGLDVPIGLATINYIQSQLDKLDHKQSVRVATTANIGLSGAQTIDGVAVTSGDRVLVKNQVDAMYNGIWAVSGSSWSRASDANESPEITSGLIVYVEEGAVQGKTRWQLTTQAPIVMNSTILTFGNITSGMAPITSPFFLGSPSAPNLAPFATGPGLVNADTMIANGVRASTIRRIVLTFATVVLAAADAGSAIEITGSGGGTLRLPLANTVPPGASIMIRSGAEFAATNLVRPQGSDQIAGSFNTGPAPGQLRQGESVILVSNGQTGWFAFSETNEAVISDMFKRGQLMSGVGYMKIPGYNNLILQWGSGTTNTTTGLLAVSFPIQFPNAIFCVQATDQCADINSINEVGTDAGTVSGFNAFTANHAGAPQGSNFKWIAIGF